MKTLVLVFLFILGVTYSQVCEKIIRESKGDDELMHQLYENLDLLKNEIRCIDILLRNGFYKAANRLLELYSRSNVKFYPVLKNSIKIIKDNLEKFDSFTKFTENEFQTATPAVFWAQSMDTIYLQIKLSHRHDTPGCIEVLDENAGVTTSEFYFSATCKQSDSPIKFHWFVPLYQIVVENSSTLKKDSVGRVVVTLKKQFPSYWKTLQRPGLSAPNVKIWYDMRKRFEDELQHHYDEEEEEELKREEEEAKKELEAKREEARRRRAQERENKRNENSTTSTNNQETNTIQTESQTPSGDSEAKKEEL